MAVTCFMNTWTWSLTKKANQMWFGLSQMLRQSQKDPHWRMSLDRILYNDDGGDDVDNDNGNDNE